MRLFFLLLGGGAHLVSWLVNVNDISRLFALSLSLSHAISIYPCLETPIPQLCYSLDLSPHNLVLPPKTSTTRGSLIKPVRTAKQKCLITLVVPIAANWKVSSDWYYDIHGSVLPHSVSMTLLNIKLMFVLMSQLGDERDNCGSVIEAMESVRGSSFMKKPRD